MQSNGRSDMNAKVARSAKNVAHLFNITPKELSTFAKAPEDALHAWERLCRDHLNAEQDQTDAAKRGNSQSKVRRPKTITWNDMVEALDAIDWKEENLAGSGLEPRTAGYVRWLFEGRRELKSGSRGRRGIMILGQPHQELQAMFWLLIYLVYQCYTETFTKRAKDNE